MNGSEPGMRASVVAVDEAKKRAKDAAMGAEDAAQEAGKKLGDWSFGLLFDIGVAPVTVVMNVKSFRVLTDSSVKSYFS